MLARSAVLCALAGSLLAVPLVEADFWLLLPLSAMLEARRRGYENLR